MLEPRKPVTQLLTEDKLAVIKRVDDNRIEVCSAKTGYRATYLPYKGVDPSLLEAGICVVIAPLDIPYPLRITVDSLRAVENYPLYEALDEKTDPPHGSTIELELVTLSCSGVRTYMEQLQIWYNDRRRRENALKSR